jgi:aspartyl-tRNA(Asn)/glutamyl-tRNA(Gln) amidotransferase subunit A
MTPWEHAEQLGAVVRRWDATSGGRPLAVKELMAVAGVPTTASSRLDDDRPAAEDSTPVGLLRAAGWEPVATTRTHEHAWGITSRTPDGEGVRNPVDPSRIAGGSSGGSAVAVAVGAVDLATGTDTAGSVRIPAAWCGVLGLKVTHGAVPLDGCRALAPSLDAAGLLARDLEVLREGLDAWGVRTAGPSPRIGRAVLPRAPELPDDLAELIDAACGGEPAADVVLPDAQELLQVFSWVQLSEALYVHRATWPARRHEYGADVAARLTLAESTHPPADLHERRHRLRDAVLGCFDDVDVLVLPMTACGPSTLDDPDHVDGVPLRDLVLPFTTPASLCGLPAMSVPCGTDRDGLPVGLQLVARPNEEAALLAAAERVLRSGG